MRGNDHTAYGLRDGKLLFIEDVQSGLACDCVCASCGQPLIAKKGALRRHHFAHFEITDCQGSGETILHRLSKELLAGLESLMVPPYIFIKKRKSKFSTLVAHEARVAKGGLVRVDSVRVEEVEEGFVPDIIIESDSKSLIVEVAVTHKVSRTKLRRIRKRDLPAIEIRLDRNDAFLSRDELKAKLQSNLDSKVWLFHPAQREEERRFFSKCRDAIAKYRMRLSIPVRRTPNQGAAHFRSEFPAPLQPPLSEYDRTRNEFHKMHGRDPTMEECLELWPHLWKP